jgi:hypothetical protein
MKCKYCGKNSRVKNAIFCSKKCDAYYSKALARKNNSESVRITFNMNRDISDRLREIQSILIQNKCEHIPFSQVLNDILGEGIKTKKMTLKNI